jgi:cell volume regulation protein A
VASVAAGALSFGIADVSGGSGFLAVYLVGPCHRQHAVPISRPARRVPRGTCLRGPGVMFVVLGLLVSPHEPGAVALSGLALAALLVLLIRPIAVWVSTAFNRFTTRERRLLGWAGLRGAVPIVLGTIVLSSTVDDSKTIFHAVFFVVVSTLVQGTTLEWVAEKLQVASVGPREVAPPLEVGALSSLDLIEFDVAPPTMRSPARQSASSDCRGRRWSQSSDAATRRSRRAAAR